MPVLPLYETLLLQRVEQSCQEEFVSVLSFQKHDPYFLLQEHGPLFPLCKSGDEDLFVFEDHQTFENFVLVSLAP